MVLMVKSVLTSAHHMVNPAWNFVGPPRVQVLPVVAERFVVIWAQISAYPLKCVAHKNYSAS